MRQKGYPNLANMNSQVRRVKKRPRSFIQQHEENDAADGNIYRGYCQLLLDGHSVDLVRSTSWMSLGRPTNEI